MGIILQTNQAALIGKKKPVLKNWFMQNHPPMQLLYPGSPDYPKRLLDLSDPPSPLYICGDAALFERPAVAIVGSRNASLQGLYIASELSKGLAEAGFLIMGLDYSYLRIKQIGGKLYMSQMICKNADKEEVEKETESVELKSNLVYLKVKVTQNGVCSFSFSEDESNFKNIGIPFNAREGKWIGAKLGFVALRNGFINNAGNCKVDWIRFNS